MSVISDSEAEFDSEIEKSYRKKAGNNRSKREKNSHIVSSYREADSDDEFAREHFILPLNSENGKARRRNGKKGKMRSKTKPEKGPEAKRNVEGGEVDADEEEEVDDEEDDDDDEDNKDKVVYRIQQILGRTKMLQSEWRKVCDGVNTRELTNFSCWQQPDEEYYNNSETPVEKFFVKWVHSSYLHCSWETEKDLLDLVGKTAKQHLKKFRLREYEGTELFEDLAKGELFPSSLIEIERILDCDDPDHPIMEVDWENARIPELSIKVASFSKVNAIHSRVDVAALKEDEIDVSDDLAFEESRKKKNKTKRPLKVKDDSDETIEKEEHETEELQPQKKKSRKTVAKKAIMNYLHGENVWLTVKWEGLPYSEVSFESLKDIISRGVEYEQQLRYFYRREQRQDKLAKKEKNKTSNLTLKRIMKLDHTIIGSESVAPQFPGGSLRDYQWEGVRWMLFNLLQNRNCILADEMGLGKTIQSAALLQMIKNHQQKAGPFLVIAPLSTIVNWQREINAWTNLDAILYYGSQEDRDLIRSYEFKFLDKNCQSYKIEVIITTPETCVAADDKNTTRVRRELSSIDWDLIIVDEAHKLKNYDSKLASTLREEYTFANCVLLTGTPLQNNTEELWNLLNFIARDDFADREQFISDFGELKTALQLEKLHKNIKPYLLRREKEFVEKTVPPKEEIIIEVELTVPQKQYYRAIYEQKTGFLYKAGAKDGPSLSNLAMELRKCCNHPFLIKGATVEISKHFQQQHGALTSPIDILVKTSGKMTLLDKLLPKLFKDGHRVLIFSQFRMVLDIIEDYIHYLGYQYDRVDGSIVGKKRQAAIDRYTNNDSVFIMLLSTKAGGVGINLTAADTVIIFDSDWNPQNDIQAQARAHRIGQTKPVTVYRLLTKKTYEMVMFRAASIKLGLDYAVMHNLKGSVEITLPTIISGNGKTTRQQKTASALAGISAERAEHVSSLSKKELENLLKHGAYDMFLEEKEGVSETESKCFVDSTIEQILEKSSTFVHKENDANIECTKSATVASNSFAKASFISAADATSTDNEVAIDDPDFWTKVVGLSVEEAESGVGRKRKCRELFNGSYRELTDSIISIYGSKNAAYITDSENEEDRDNDTAPKEESKRKKRRKLEDGIENLPADWTNVESLMNILTATIGFGYGNWKEIRKASKCFWMENEIAKAAIHGILFLLLAISIQTETPLVVVSSSPCGETGPSKIDEPLKEIPPEEEKGKARSEIILMEVESTPENQLDCGGTETSKIDEPLKETPSEEEKGKALSETIPVEIVPTAEHQPVKNVTVEDKQVPITIDKSPIPSAGYNYCVKTFIASANKYHGVKLALKIFSSISENDASGLAEDLLLKNFKAIFVENQSNIPSEELTAESIKNCYNETFALELSGESSEQLKSGEILIEKLLKNDLISLFILQDNELNKSAKKAANKAKLSQIEDLFEAKIYATLAGEETPRQATVSDSEKLLRAEDNDITSDYITPADDQHEVPQQQQPAPLVMFTGNLYVLHREFKDAVPSVNETPEWWNANCDAFTLCKAAELGWLDGKKRFLSFIESMKANKEILQISSDLTSEKTGEDENDLKETNAECAPNLFATNEIIEKLNPKFLIQRLKVLTRHLRCTDEDKLSAEKVAEKLQLTAAKAEKAEKLLKKKNAQSLLRTIQKIGYPRSSYSTITNPDLVLNPHYLLDWLTFLQETGITNMNTDEVKEEVYQAISLYNRFDELNTKEKEMITEGFFSDLSVKLIESSFEKTDLIHHIRLLLAFHTEVDVVDLIKNNCKITGSNIPTYKRDTNMPVWWTQQHDVELLKLSIINGCSQWKKVSAEPSLQSPENYIVPPRVNGQEWITQLTPKALEKRIIAILRGMPQIKTFVIPPPLSPQKKQSATNKSVIPAPITKGILWFQNKSSSSTNTSIASKPLAVPTINIEKEDQQKTALVDLSKEELAEATFSSSPMDKTPEGNVTINMTEMDADFEVKILAAIQDTQPTVHSPTHNYMQSMQSMYTEKETEEIVPHQKQTKDKDNSAPVELLEKFANSPVKEQLPSCNSASKVVDISDKFKSPSAVSSPPDPVSVAIDLSAIKPAAEIKKAKSTSTSLEKPTTSKKGKAAAEAKPVQTKGILHFFGKPAEKKIEN